MTISKAKLSRIRSKVIQYLNQEETMEDDDYDPDDDDMRLNEAIGYCALELNLRDETVERYWHKFMEQEL